MHVLLGIIVLVLLATDAMGQAQPPSQNPYRIEIVLERNERDAWRAIDSRLVLEQNDRVRFRVRTNFSGYLYVTNQGTSGKYEVLFPGAGSGRENKVEAGREYVVPANQGSFRITGPAGQEIVYWLVSPVELTAPAPEPPAKPRPDAAPPRNPTLIPRCDDTVLRARGDCLDISAGPKEVNKSNGLPGDLARVPDLKSRDLVFIRQQNTSVVSSPVPISGPVIYEFRLAHR